ncbi:MAG: AAA family ATPase, partial [Oscillibacter sp.]|nr:AAA family ATPase [Oscillibacter sp.]
KDGEKKPTKGSYKRTAGELIAELEKCGGDIGAVLGDYDEDTGAWIRFNPLDGEGVSNQNITDFRYALVESDTTELDAQNALIRELELPVACLVFSGKKSLHAIVRIDAKDRNEYRRRVELLYDICRKNGLDVDQQNKNPARLSRMPGILRNGRKQYLVATNIGKANWAEWMEWVESNSDDLPDPENMAGAWDNLPELAQPLIEGILRQGHKMLLAGPSKAGKSYALIELCCAIAEGRPWLGFSCTQGRVLYVNLELDRASCLHRFRDVYEAAGWTPQNLKNIDVWNLRGRSIPMDKLAPKLIRRARKKDYLAIVIDPIYKVITGDENSADQMARFCNYFDTVCTELNCAVIYCHHHSKGIQGGKRSMDRASGSGVFARDPDALLDLIELPISDSLRKQEINNAVGRACTAALKAIGKLGEVSQDDLCSENAALRACEGVLDARGYKSLLEAADAAKRAAEARTAWRIEGTLREFPKFPPVNLWFDYPIHLSDESGVLADIDPETPSIQKATDKRKKSAKEKRNDRKRKLEDALANANMGEPPTVKEVVEYLSTDSSDISQRTVRNWLKEFGYTINKNAGNVIEKAESEESDEE